MTTTTITLLQVFLGRQEKCRVCKSSTCLEYWHCERTVWIDGEYHSQPSYSKLEFTQSPNRCPFCGKSPSSADRMRHSCETIHRSLFTVSVCGELSVLSIPFLDKLCRHETPRDRQDQQIKWSGVKRYRHDVARGKATKKPYCYTRSIVFCASKKSKPSHDDDDGLMVLL